MITSTRRTIRIAVIDEGILVFNGACRWSLNVECQPNTFSSRVCFVTTIITNHGACCVAECHPICRVHLANNSRNDESSGVSFHRVMSCAQAVCP